MIEKKPGFAPSPKPSELWLACSLQNPRQLFDAEVHVVAEESHCTAMKPESKSKGQDAVANQTVKLQFWAVQKKVSFDVDLLSHHSTVVDWIH